MVNTFLPYSNYRKIAKTLDTKRLGKQRVEAKQILDAIKKKNAWSNHPATKMWKNYSNSLREYYNCMLDEWVKRGYKNTMRKAKVTKPVTKPWFVKNKILQLSHQASLLRKEPRHYKKYFTHVPPKYKKYSYVWPSHLNKEQLKLIKKSSQINNIQNFAKKLK